MQCKMRTSRSNKPLFGLQLELRVCQIRWGEPGYALECVHSFTVTCRSCTSLGFACCPHTSASLRGSRSGIDCGPAPRWNWHVRFHTAAFLLFDTNLFDHEPRRRRHIVFIFQGSG